MAQLKWLLPLLLPALLAQPVVAANKAAATKAPNSSVEALVLKRNYKAAVSALLQAANAGDVKAMVKLGHAYRLGLGIAPDLAEARKWYERAAGAGNAQAKLLLTRFGTEVPATVVKTVGSGTAAKSRSGDDGVDFAHLPARPGGQPGWFEIAAAHQDHVAMTSLHASANGDAALISAQLGDADGLKAAPQDHATVDGLGRSPVMLALVQDKPDVLAAALNAKPDLALADKQGLTATGQAAAQCDAAKLAALVAAGAPLSGGSNPALVVATRMCTNWADLKAVFAGSDFNVVDPQGHGAAWFAAAKGDVSLLGWIADQGGKLDLADKSGMTPLHSAASASQGLAFRFLLNKGNANVQNSTRSVTPLMLSAYSGCVACVTALLDNKAALDERDSGGDTALMYAVRGLQGKVAQKLVDSGANLNAKNNAADTPAKLGSRLGLYQQDQQN